MKEEKNEVSTNLFDYATSELSQDAYLCWLISWINHKKDNKELYNVAHDFLELIFKRKGINNEKNFEIKKEIKRQDEHSDIYITLENGYYIIIEDKINFDEHKSGKDGKPQLVTYKDRIVNKYDIENKKMIITVYYKTFDYDPTPVSADVKITREDMLEILNKRNIDNVIYNDYRDKLQSIEDELNGRKTTPIIKWTDKNEKLIRSFVVNNISNNSLFCDSSVGRSSGKHGSIYINWQYKKIDSATLFNTKIGFDLIHLAVNINYKRADIYLKADTTPEFKQKYEQIQNYDKEERKRIQGRLKELFSKKLGNCFIDHDVRSGKKSFRLLTIDIPTLCNKNKEDLMEEDLYKVMEMVTKAYKKIMKEENFKN